MTVDFGLYGVFDLAILKTAAPGPYLPGDIIKYDITVYNQGTLNAFNIQISDYIPDGLEMVDANWVLVGDTARLVTPILDLAAGASTVVPIKLMIANDFMGTQLVNNAEIEFAASTADSPVSSIDVDSQPGNEDGTTPDPNNDDILDTTGGDDYDPHTIAVSQAFDLALIKVLDEEQPLPIEPGQDVSFDIIVVNQGSLDAEDIQISDYLPSGLTLNDADWMMIGDTARLVTPINMLAAGASDTLSITTTVDEDFTGESITNNAEIESALGEGGVIVVDSDSPDYGDQDGTIQDPNDNDLEAIDGTDDYDPETIMVDPYVSIGSTVFLDNNDDGQFDETTEVGVDSVTVLIFADADMDGTPDSATPVAEVVTDSEGNYYVDSLLAGSYVVAVVPVDSLPFSSTTTNIADDQIDNDDNGIQSMLGDTIFSPSITLAPNTEPESESGQGGNQDVGNDNDGDMTVDFGLVPTVSIGSTVFLDSNDDGFFDEMQENGIEGITVNLYDETDVVNPIATVTTDSLGNYFFGDLLPGNYVVGVIPTDSLPFSSTPTVQLDNGADNDDNGDQLTEGDEIYSPVINLTPGEEPIELAENSGSGLDDAFDSNGDMTVDFGLFGTYDLAIDNKPRINNSLQCCRDR